MAWTCPCGANNGDERRICHACGRPLFQQAPPQPVQYPPSSGWYPPPPSRPSMFTRAMKVMAVISLVLGLIGAAITPGSKIGFPVQLLIYSIVAFFAMLIVLAYFIPSILAFKNRKRLAVIISVLNFFFGWTLIGWWLLWAWGNTPEKEDWQSMRMR